MMQSRHHLPHACRVALLALLALAFVGAPWTLSRAVPARAAGPVVGQSAHNDTTTQSLRSTPSNRAPLMPRESKEPGTLPRPHGPMLAAPPGLTSRTRMPSPSQNFGGI